MENQNETVSSQIVFNPYQHISQGQYPPHSTTTTITIAPANSTNSIPSSNNLGGRRSTSNGNDVVKCSDLTLTEKIAGFIFFLIIALALVGFFISLHIYAMTFESPVFQVESVTVYPFNISSSHITANWQIKYLTKNPYDESFYYEDMKASILLKNESVSSTMIMRFYLDRQVEKERLVEANIEASSVKINGSVAESVMAEKRQNGTVTFSFQLDGDGRNEPERFNVRRHMIVICDDLMVRFVNDSQPAYLIGGPIPCNVQVVKL